MDELGDGLVHAGVESDGQQAAPQHEHRSGQAHPIASAAAPLAVPDRSEHDPTPAAQEMVLANRARALCEIPYVNVLADDLVVFSAARETTGVQEKNDR
jgi:hypothetical protein